jgi:hypothetical protein
VTPALESLCNSLQVRPLYPSRTLFGSRRLDRHPFDFSPPSDREKDEYNEIKRSNIPPPLPTLHHSLTHTSLYSAHVLGSYLKVLKLRSCGISALPLTILAHCLEKGNTTLQCLDLSLNALDFAAASALASLITGKSCARLEALVLQSCGLEGPAMDTVIDAMWNTCVTTLDLSNVTAHDYATVYELTAASQKNTR